ncbi:MAG TPA: hypothetical protein ENJ75_03185 [Candidatus Kaiserbacteria bacterium]|nr:hypothetical protein [Candidatus Kaiserbacteria bacterium]
MKKHLNAIYTMHSLNGLAGSFIGIFIPIYFLTLHYSITQVFLYYLTYVIALFFLFLFASFVARRLGLKLAFLIYFPLQLIYLGLLYTLPHTPVPLWIIAIASATATGFYWYPLHLFFLSQAKKKEMGTSVSKLYAFPKFLKIASPLIGGAIAVFGGFSLLIIITIFLYIVSSISLLYLPDIRPTVHFKISLFLNLARKYPRYLFAEIGENIREEIGSIILPIVIFITFGSILSVGFVGTLLSGGGALFMLLIGRYSDRLKRTNILRFGAILTMAIWLMFFYAQGSIPFYVLTLLEGFSGALLLIPFNSLVYDYAQENDAPAEFIIFREVPVTLARIFVYGTGLLFVSSLNYLFLLPVIGSTLFWLL